ncbi:MAG TPA: iron-sulfur cluster biosynthesis family protein [Burkholderiaceae bacterium]|jgi:iron-sulfur cluster assembly protein|nr:iron-sulfur cluster biosynthesis family protein [Burkholderiaceae bacterium]HOS87387.1 iron-sulfur cluster biosynthesis family protein [Burkholderiaceae bacterium]HPL77990.1 iron-sulfur cluster biosynthesis family protein [Burkholderiaceae bacterium]
MFTLTTSAAQQIQQAAASSGAQEMALRIAAKIDPDGSKQYGMGFDDPTEEDMKLDLKGVAVVIAGESQVLLADTVLDYVELNPGEFNFIFINARDFQDEVEPVPSGGCGSGACATGGCTSKGRTH